MVTENQLKGRGTKSFTYVTTTKTVDKDGVAHEVTRVRRFCGTAYFMFENSNIFMVSKKFARGANDELLDYRNHKPWKLSKVDGLRHLAVIYPSYTHIFTKGDKHVKFPNDWKAINESSKSHTPLVWIRINPHVKYKVDFYVDGREAAPHEAGAAGYEFEPYLEVNPLTGEVGGKYYANCRQYDARCLYVNEKRARR